MEGSRFKVQGSRFIKIVLMLCVLIFGCSKKEEKIPPDIIQKDIMVRVMTDMHLAESHAQFSSAYDNSKNTKQSYYKFIFDKYKISYEQFMKSWKYYTAHPEIFSKIYDEVITELSKKQAEASKEKQK